MYLYKVLFSKHPRKIYFFSALALLAGIVNAFLFMYINLILGDVISSESLEIKWHIFSFLFVLWLFSFSRRYLALSLINFTHDNLYDFKSDIIHLLLHSDYLDVHKKKDSIYNVLTRDIEQVATAGNILTNLMSSTILVIGCLAFIAVISWKLFFITLLVIIAGVITHFLNMKRLTPAFAFVKSLNDEFVSFLNQVIYGFKEITVAKEKGRDIESNFLKKNLKRFRQAAVETYASFMNSQHIGSTLFYLSVGFILILGNTWLNIEKGDLVTFVFILLFIYGPIEAIIILLPVIAEANVSSRRLVEMQEMLKGNRQHQEGLSANIKEFNTLELQDIRFKYETIDNQFSIGPISLIVTKGDLIFIHGGNGSGKTSFIMCLLGIYPCSSGTIVVDEHPAGENYSSLFSPVFSDFFLFDRFYGMRSFDREKVSMYLKLFELDTKVSINEEGFSSISLSMGQRKRLALIQALLEDKPILVLDEWAADQDPYFRKKFYMEVLPLIKKEGKTIIAITHDDRYFNVADKLFRMEEGKLTIQNQSEK